MSSRGDTLTKVLDYVAMGQPQDKPRRLHREDCWHPFPDRVWRDATAEELAHLPVCDTCSRRDARKKLG